MKFFFLHSPLPLQRVETINLPLKSGILYRLLSLEIKLEAKVAESGALAIYKM